MRDERCPSLMIDCDIRIVFVIGNGTRFRALFTDPGLLATIKTSSACKTNNIHAFSCLMRKKANKKVCSFPLRRRGNVTFHRNLSRWHRTALLRLR